MIYTIDTDKCREKGVPLAELWATLFLKFTPSIQTVFEEMLQKQRIVKDISQEYLITQPWNDLISEVILNSEPGMPNDSSFETLAEALSEIFPKGKKEGTTQYWRGNKRELSLRLKKFFKLYGNSYTSDQILEAARKYVEGFNGNYIHMRILKYFIWKDSRVTLSDGTTQVVEVSDLANYLENSNQEDCLKEDWTSILN